MKYILLLTTSLIFSGCVFSMPEHETVSTPQAWISSAPAEAVVDPESLHHWWTRFNDPVLTQLIETALQGSPDRKIAEARVLEARGLYGTVRSSLFPQIGLSGTAGRESSFVTNFKAGDLYQAGFDASYEIDIFGRNRNTVSAAESNLAARKAEYEFTSLTLIAEVARTYVELRAAQKQVGIAEKNLDSQTRTLDLVRQQNELGEAPRLDVERAEGLVNTTRAAIPEFSRQGANARLRLSVLTGELPERIVQRVSGSTGDISVNIAPVLSSPVEVLAQRPDIRAAQYDLEARTSLTKAQIANIFPTITVAGLFGVADTAITDPTKIWSATINAAVSLLDFGRIQSGIDVAKAQEMQAFELWRKTILQGITDVETALTDYAHITQRLNTLQQAVTNAEHSLDLSQQLYKEGEISFLDVLDAQRTLNNANAAVVGAEEARGLSIIAVYKSLGVY